MENTTTPEIGMARLKATLEKLKTLDESAFDYSEFIEKFDNEKMCPTVGCVAGYLPMWFSDTPFKYTRNGSNYLGIQFALSYTLGFCGPFIKKGLVEYYNCSEAIIEALFFGYSLEEHLGQLVIDKGSLGVVVQRFKTVITLIENGKLSWN